MVYDTLGRKSEMFDPDMGHWVYHYDPNGNLTTQTDAKSQTITFEYDELNRVTSKTYSTEASDNPPVSYTYDNPSIQNGNGRLYSVSNTKATTITNGYDSMGRATSTTKTIQGNPAQYITATTYDYAGKPVTMTYPVDGYSVTNTYHPGSGLLHQVTGSNGVVYATNTDYEPTGKIGQLDHGNNTHTRYTYDSKSARLTSIITTSPASNGEPKNDVINRGYTYTPAGDIAIITDYKKGDSLGLPGDVFNYTYTYDKLHRFTNEATTNNVYNPVVYTYNAIGNILTKNVGTTNFAYTYDPVKKHAVSSIQINGGTSYSFGYDANGNMTTGYDLTDLQNISARTISYNADNMPVQVVHARYGTTNIFYDGTSNRVKKVSPSGTTYYIGEHYEVINSEPIKYVFAGNLRIAKVKSTETYYFHKDHLGSSAAMTTDAGTVVETSNYMPFGEMREHTGLDLSNYKFTDQEFDPETGLYYYGARYYDPTIGRFISPDSVVQDPYDPQTLNRYTYCRNNPIIYTDPSGNIPILAVAAIVATIAAAYTGSQTNWNVEAMAKSAAVAFVATYIGGSIGSAVTSALTPVGATTPGLLASMAGGAAGGAVGGAIYSAAYGGNIAQGALFGAIGGAVGGAVGAAGISDDILKFSAQVASAGVTSGVLAELSGAKFSQGAIPAMMTAAAVSIVQMSAKQNQKIGVVSEVNAQNKATSDLAVLTSANSETQVYGKGPESCGYWGELAQNANDSVSGSRFESTEYVCKKATTPDAFPASWKNWDRWVRACLQDYHELYSMSLNISRYTYTRIEFMLGHEACFTAGFTFDFNNPPAGLTR